MNLFGLSFNITNNVGKYSFLSLLVLAFLYLMRPKPFKKIIPSLIFLEKSTKRLNMASFFRKFVKDWLFFLQLLLILLLCFTALGLTTELNFKKINKEMVFVIDASASSKALDNNEMLFEKYINIAKKNLGVRNTIILIKNTPEIIAKQTNPINAVRILSSVKPSDSLSNIWDAMMIASELSETSNIMVLSDFSDTNNKDLNIAKKLLMAKGFNVELINPKKDQLRNIGIIKHVISGNKTIADVKNFDTEQRKIIVKKTDEELILLPNEVKQFTVEIETGLNKIEIETGDDFYVDDFLYVIIPEDSQKTVLFITNQKTSFLYSALSSVKNLEIKKVEPPIVKIDDQDIIVMDNIEYSKLLPGTINDIRKHVKSGSSLIIAAQDNFDLEKLQELLSVEIINQHNQDVSIYNSGIDKFNDFNFGLSSRYYETSLKNNNSVVIADAYDKLNSPVIVLSKHGNGNILFYGIFDNHNSFKLSSEYPLFWLNILDLLVSKQDFRELNLGIGSIIYGGSIKDPDGRRSKDFTRTDQTGVYKVDDTKVGVNLLNNEESNLNSELTSDTMLEEDYERKKIKQTVSMLSFLIILCILLALFEVYIIKKRGDV